MAPYATAEPTRTQYHAYSEAFDHFNCELFGGKLPSCMLNFTRKAKMAGYFAAEQWRKPKVEPVPLVEALAGEKPNAPAHEITLNPDILSMPLEYVMATLVHEMVHLWQQEFGRPPRAGYHDRQWAEKMEELGLMPSSTGRPGGKKTGQRMSDYPVKGGKFERALVDMPDTAVLPWISGRPGAGRGDEEEVEAKKKNKVMYMCPGLCRTKVWGKPGLYLLCGLCQVNGVSPTPRFKEQV